jgi:hypothetical protein
VDAPCHYCTERGLDNCHKIRKSEMDASLTPSQPITTFDPSDDQQTLQELTMIYDSRLLKYRGRVIVILLARTFVACYGQWISHRGLRHAILTHLCGTSSFRSNIHALEAYQFLQEKLNSPMEIDSADLFTSFLLALGRFPRDNFWVHANGILAIMRHLSQLSPKNDSSSLLLTLWPLIRDELLSKALILDSGGYVGLRKGFEQVLGHEDIAQRKRYKREISFGDSTGHVKKYVDLAGSGYQSEAIVLYCNWRTLRFKAFGGDSIDPFVLSIMADMTGKASRWKVDQPPLSPNFQNLPRLVKEYSGTTAEQARNDRMLLGLCEYHLYHQLLRLSTTILRAPSVCEGLRLESSSSMLRLHDLFVQIEKAFQQEQIGKTIHHCYSNVLVR